MDNTHFIVIILIIKSEIEAKNTKKKPGLNIKSKSIMTELN